ncbi:MAG: RNA polymerase sigma factor [Methylophilaceae bacterium]
MEFFLSSIEGRAFRIAQIATGNRDDALDIVQDTMAKMVQNYSTYAKDEWRPLFYRVLQTRILDWHRRQKVRNRFRSWFHWNNDDHDEDGHEDFISQQPARRNSDPDVILQDAQFMGDLNSALSALPLRQQQVFLMRVWEGLDIAETAIAMQCSESSVKTHYARALGKLRAQLQQHT